jgi:hypothetical protein
VFFLATVLSKCNSTSYQQYMPGFLSEAKVIDSALGNLGSPYGRNAGTQKPFRQVGAKPSPYSVDTDDVELHSLGTLC